MTSKSCDKEIFENFHFHPPAIRCIVYQLQKFNNILSVVEEGKVRAKLETFCWGTFAKIALVEFALNSLLSDTCRGTYGSRKKSTKNE
ncbi:hypothetical protein CEXT_682681 [Caerostris extrusa]|uniref:Uncharacterized protein n=1 Tax=Caerostris extrusa TaxID=172846 RepID=A0AAV4RN12_CAEEX|nr:hypothetical protein CEXT_682681 [Caerostris extrusa]